MIISTVTNRQAPPDLSLEHVIYEKPGHLIRRLQQLAVSVFLQETAGFDITPPQYGALAAIRAHPGIDQLRLGNALGLDRTTVMGIVARLESKRLITRVAGAADRRTRQLELTDAGGRLLKRMFPHTERAQLRMLEGLSRTEQRLFVQFLTRLVNLNNDVNRIRVKAPPAGVAPQWRTQRVSRR
jgi:MarR family transcriptional regulator, lower aerobic nicotinate degradation pathway regulator